MWCSFCATEEHFDAMTFEQARELLLHLKSGGTRNVILGGGEPFSWPHDVISIARLAHQEGFFVQIGTNAVELPSPLDQIPWIDRYVLPLESMDPKIHNQLRRYRERHHQIILSALAQLKAIPKSVTISTVVTQINKGGLKNIMEFLVAQHAEHVHAWHLYQLLPVGRGGSRGQSLQVPLEEYLELTEELKKWPGPRPFAIYRRQNMYESQQVRFFWYEGGVLRTKS